MTGDTIAAVSTPRGKGGVALLRVSGEDAVMIAERVFLPRNGKPLREAEARHALYGSILDAEGQTVDDGIATVFRAPASFTGEDTVEICCHGGILLTETVLTALHDLSLAARFCDRVYVLKDGRNLCDGQPETLISSELVKELYQIEAEVFTRKDRIYIDYK